MSTTFDFYYSHEAEQFTFYRIPKALFTDPQFHELSVEAKVLYGLMLDRVGLSVRSGWVDQQKRVYIYFTVAEVREQLNCSHSKAVRILKELDQGIGLIRRKRQGLGKPDRIYVMNFASIQSSQNDTSQQEVPAQSIAIEPQNAEPPHCRSMENGTQADSNPDTIKNDKNKTEIINTESINPLSEQMEGLRIDQRYMDSYALLWDKWGYTALRANYTSSELQGIFSLGADILTSTAPTIRINRQEIPRQQVVDRFLSLDFTHIDYVLECMRKNVVRSVRNMRSYLLTALYNAPTTIDAYINAQFSIHERGDAAKPYA